MKLNACLLQTRTLAAVALGLFFGGTAIGQVTQPTPQVDRLEARYLTLGGSETNTASLVQGLRTGTPVTLVDPVLPGGTTALATTFSPPTRPMGYGNINRALDFASRDLAAAGITQPTAAQLQTALMGGTVTNAAGQISTMQGVLALRSQGMGWGKIAHTIGVSPGLGNSKAVAAPVTTTSTRTSAVQTPVGPAHGSATASVKSQGQGRIVTAAGTQRVTGPSAKSDSQRGGIVTGAGITTAGGASIHSGGNATLGNSAAAQSGLGGGHGAGKGGSHGK
jgi:hypothetical protein